MADVPANQKLWNMYVAQAKARYRTWPSPTAAKWVHDHYVQAGGKFVGSTREVDPRFRDDSEKAKASKRAAPRREAPDKKKKDK